jgi:hypothetical protein
MSDLATIGTYSVFIASYVVFALGKFPGMKIRPARRSDHRATLMFITDALRVENAFHFIHFGAVVLLFFMMLLVSPTGMAVVVSELVGLLSLKFA